VLPAHVVAEEFVLYPLKEATNERGTELGEQSRED